MVVFDPLKIVITNYPEGKTEQLMSEENPEDPSAGNREIPFSRELYIEQEDFMEEATKKYFRLSPGKVVRLKSAYIIQCDEVVKDEDGKIKELRCTYVPESKSGSDTSGINVKGTIHWVSIPHAVSAEIRLYDRLFNIENLDTAEGDFKDHLNSESLKVLSTVYAEPSLRESKLQSRYQFIRKGYFTMDKDSTSDRLIFNRTVTLRDMWAKKG
jgi:glutaminyl-tRNA synthetase